MTASLAQVSYGLTMRFEVQVDGLDLGAWSSCKGLSLKCKPFVFRETGNVFYDEIQPGEISYVPVVLERAMDKESSVKVQTWLGTTFDTWLGSSKEYDGGTAKITLKDAVGSTVSTWTLQRVYPTGWTGPTLSAKDNNVAIESLELTHAGFF